MKCGPPPPQWLTLKNSEGRRINPLWVAYHRQTSLYQLGLAAEHKIVAKRAGLHLYDGTYKFVPHTDYHDGPASILMVRSYHDRMQFQEA